MLIVSALLFAGLLALALYLISGDVLRLGRMKDDKAQVAQGPYSGPATLEGGISAYDMGDYVSAKRILLPLAENGVARAQNMIGLMYTLGHGYSLNETTGCDWFEKAANSGYPSAQFNLGLCYQKAEGRAKDLSQALLWYDRAWLNGDFDGAVNALHLVHENDKDDYTRRLQILAKEGHAFARTLRWAEVKGGLFIVASPTEILCVWVMNFWLNYPLDHCDVK